MEESEIPILKKIKKEQKNNIFIYHDLNNLVYEKRERKQIQRLETPSTIKQKKNINKIMKKQDQKQENDTIFQAENHQNQKSNLQQNGNNHDGNNQSNEPNNQKQQNQNPSQEIIQQKQPQQKEQIKKINQLEQSQEIQQNQNQNKRKKTFTKKQVQDNIYDQQQTQEIKQTHENNQQQIDNQQVKQKLQYFTIQKDQKGKEQNGKEQNGKEQKEQNGKDQKQQNGKEEYGKQYNDQKHIEQNNQKNIEQNDQKAIELNDQKNIEQNDQIDKTLLKQDKNDQEQQKEEEQIEVMQDKKIDCELQDQNSKQQYLQLITKLNDIRDSFFNSKTFINCDIRYFNIDYIIENTGYFDVILMDPPWRIKGAQQIDSQFMFSNSRFSLDYNTMSNQEIMNLRIDKISKNGFIFLWILNTQMNSAYEILNAWGYEVVDQIIWVKLKDGKVNMTHGYYFMHSFEICLVGIKQQKGSSLKYFSKISNNLIFADIRKKSQKPDQLYEIIDALMPNAKKIEIFARNHNLRPGWLSLGNQLGDLYDKWFNKVECNNCFDIIQINVVRYKGKKQVNYDLCEKCFQNLDLDANDFFKMENNVDEEVFHQYHKCNKCEIEPIWGTRFNCIQCNNFDLCETCFDLNLETNFHDLSHDYNFHEFPVLADGLPAHKDLKCNGCFQKPIIGVCFKCSQCTSFNLCQNCHFSKYQSEITVSRGHKSDHKMDILIEPINISMKKKKLQKCAWCFREIQDDDKYKCQNCFNFFFCNKCYDCKDQYKTNLANTHKAYHKFVFIQRDFVD